VRARELAAEYPTVTPQTPAVDAARLLADTNLPGLVVVDDQDRPVTILPGTQVLRMVVPRYCQDDPALARVIDEPHADLFWRELSGKTVAECLPEQPRELPVVDPEATALEMAALMARTRSPLVAVAGKDAPMLGVVTLDALMDRMLASGDGGDSGDGQR
jgi:CBS domain-containing protein